MPANTVVVDFEARNDQFIRAARTNASAIKRQARSTRQLQRQMRTMRSNVNSVTNSLRSWTLALSTASAVKLGLAARQAMLMASDLRGAPDVRRVGQGSVRGGARRTL